MNSCPSRCRLFVRLAIAVGLLAAQSACKSDGRQEAPIRVAVASNFLAPMQRLASEFEKKTGHRVELSSGSSGKLLTQIENGAPFDLFLSADSARPALLENKRLAEAGSRFTYAIGRLALYGPAVHHPKDGLQDLSSNDFRHLSMPNPNIAPYGAAARQTLERAKLADRLKARVVLGENVAQAQQFVESGAAELGFVALSSVKGGGRYPFWVVPDEMHDRIRQDAVLLRNAKSHPAASALSGYLRSPSAKEIIARAGYAGGDA